MLGQSLSEFMRQVGLNPANGTGKRSDARRLRDQMNRLFHSSISFQQTMKAGSDAGKRFINMQVAASAELWWSPRNPTQASLWHSWIELGEHFFEALTSAPVPLDMRALRALRRSPLALDLYSLLTYLAFVANRKGSNQAIAWSELEKQLGAGYAEMKDFRKKVNSALKKIREVLPGLRLANTTTGFLIAPESIPAISPIK